MQHINNEKSEEKKKGFKYKKHHNVGQSLHETGDSSILTHFHSLIELIIIFN